MIPRPHIVEWGRRVGWPTDEQDEQDLLMSRLIVEIARDSYLGDELVFRGGTACASCTPTRCTATARTSTMRCRC